MDCRERQRLEISCSSVTKEGKAASIHLTCDCVDCVGLELKTTKLTALSPVLLSFPLMLGQHEQSR
jgi:hypothetical protein